MLYYCCLHEEANYKYYAVKQNKAGKEVALYQTEMVSRVQLYTDSSGRLPCTDLARSDL